MGFDFAAARRAMLDSQVRTADVTDLAIQAAMRTAPRESLLPPQKQSLAYADAEVPYAPGRVLVRPRTAGKLLQALAPKAGETALAIAAPYLALVLETMGVAVTRHDGDDLAAAPAGPFDLVVSEGAVEAAPAAWLDALAPEGRLGVIERTGAAAKAVVYLKAADGVGRREVFDAAAPYLPGFEPKSDFVF